MADAPEVKPHDEVRIGDRRAVVCTVHSPGRVEVVHLERNHAINEDAVWLGDRWGFEHPGPTGGYADKHDRLRAFVTQLRRPRA